MVVTPSGVVRNTVRYGDAMVWRSRRPTVGPRPTRLTVVARVSRNLHVNCIPIALSVDGDHYVHWHASTFESFQHRFYVDRNYADGRGDVETVSPTVADREWHTYGMEVSATHLSAWLDGARVFHEPWPFQRLPWFWEIKVLGDHRGDGVVFEFRDVHVEERP